MPPVFRENPTLEIVQQVLECFSLSSLNDSNWFSKELIKLSSLETLFPLLEPFYLPCKAKLYLYDSNLTYGRAITILKQILKTQERILIAKEKTIAGKKSTMYQIQYQTSSISSTIPSDSLVISFD